MPSTTSELLSQLGASKPGFMLLLLCPSLEARQGSVPRGSPANMPHTAWGGQAAGVIENMTLARCGLCRSQVQAQTASVPSGRQALLGAPWAAIPVITNTSLLTPWGGGCLV